MRQNLIRRLPCMIYHLDIFQSNTYKKSPHNIGSIHKVQGPLFLFKVPIFARGQHFDPIPLFLRVSIFFKVSYLCSRCPFLVRVSIFVQGPHSCSKSPHLHCQTKGPHFRDRVPRGIFFQKLIHYWVPYFQSFRKINVKHVH